MDLSGRKVLWKTPLPHRSNAAPILVDNRVFVCAEPNLLLCLAADTGEKLWQQSTTYLDLSRAAGLTDDVRAKLKSVEASHLKRFSKDGLTLTHNPKMLSDPTEDLPEQFLHPPVHLDAGFTTPTPVSDGHNVYVTLGTGLVSSFTLDGQRRWCVYPEKPSIRWGQSCSPIISSGLLIVQTDNCIAINTETGEEVWRTAARKRWATPAILQLNELELIVLGGGEVIRGSDGEIIADLFPHSGRCDALVDFWGMSSPVVHSGSVYFVDATTVTRRDMPTVQRFDLRMGPDGMLETARRWISDIPNGKYYASPIVHDENLYIIASTIRTKGWRDFESIVNRRADGTLMAFDLESGKLHFGQELGRETGTYHTCSLADDRLWITGHVGIVVAIEAGGEHRQLARMQLEPTRSNPLFVGQDVIYRGSEHIYRVTWND